MLWLKKHFGFTLSETASKNVYMSLATLNDFSIRPYPGRLHLFRASNVPNFAEIDSTLGWGTVAQGGVKVDFVAGNHVSMFQRPNIEGLARRVQQALQKSEGASVPANSKSVSARHSMSFKRA
jgi:thioesterase domain-containing protein